MSHQQPSGPRTSEPFLAEASVQILMSDPMSHGLDFGNASHVGASQVGPMQASIENSPSGPRKREKGPTVRPTPTPTPPVPPPVPPIINSHFAAKFDAGAVRKQDRNLPVGKSPSVAMPCLGEDDEIFDDPGIKRLQTFARTRSNFAAFLVKIALTFVLWGVAIATTVALAWIILSGTSLEECRIILRDWWDS